MSSQIQRKNSPYREKKKTKINSLEFKKCATCLRLLVLRFARNGSIHAVHLAKVRGMANKDKDDNNCNYDNSKKLSCNDSLRRANIMRPLYLGYALKSPFAMLRSALLEVQEPRSGLSAFRKMVLV